MSNAATAVPETRLRGRAKNSQTREIISRFMKNKVAVAGFFIILLLVFCALFPSLIAPYSYETMSTGPSFANPSAEHLFGTDEFGRDIFSRVIYGTRTSPGHRAAVRSYCLCPGYHFGLYLRLLWKPDR